MKGLSQKDLEIKKQILVENRNGEQVREKSKEEDGMDYKTLFVNTTDKLKEGEVISVINQEN